MPRFVLAAFAGGWLLLLAAGCDSNTPVQPEELAGSDLPDQPTTTASTDASSDSGLSQQEMEALLGDPGSVRFVDSVASNHNGTDVLTDLEFIDTDGNPVRVDQYIGKQNVLLVFTRGFSGSLCPFCTTQTSRLIANYDQFVARNTEVLLVYPGQKDQLDEFRAASTKDSEVERFPFPVLLDEDLNAVNRLKIAATLAHPSTFIIDTKGSVKLSYVGKNPIDRPSIKALLAQLDRLQ